MELARRTGAVSILVLSGETSEEDLKNSGISVDLVVENLGELTKLLEG